MYRGQSDGVVESAAPLPERPMARVAPQPQQSTPNLPGTSHDRHSHHRVAPSDDSQNPPTRPTTSSAMQLRARSAASGGARTSSPAVQLADENDAAAAEKPKKNKPKSTRLRQQKLPAWQPILTASTVIPTVFVVGIVFLPIGVVLYLASEGVRESVSTYSTICANLKSCSINIQLDQPFSGDVYFYYGLDNFFQNHRRYVKSRSDTQLLGKDLTSVSDCPPFDKINGTPIAPCGAIANSMFNDTFLLQYNGQNVTWTYKGVIWEVDRDRKFKNPPGPDLKAAFNNTVRPPYWQREIYQLDEKDPENNGFQNVDFIVWMRTAALPNFRKLYRILDRTQNALFANGLPAGPYTLMVNNSELHLCVRGMALADFNVSEFDGKKHFIISTTSWAGGRNSFLGVAYMAVGSFCIVLGVVFLIIHVKFGHSLAEMTSTAVPSATSRQ